jgi:membrane associated rhomboid family serine protease
MKYLFVAAFILCFIFCGTEAGYTGTSPWWSHLTYNFQHAGIIHLLVNSLSFIGLFRLMERFLNRYRLAALIIATGFVASFLSMHETPTVGASAMVYAMTGAFFALINLCRDIKILDKRKFALFVTSIAACLLVSALKGNSNFFLHVFALIIGMIAGTGVAFFREDSLREGHNILKKMTHYE